MLQTWSSVPEAELTKVQRNLLKLAGLVSQASASSRKSLARRRKAQRTLPDESDEGESESEESESEEAAAARSGSKRRRARVQTAAALSQPSPPTRPLPPVVAQRLVVADLAAGDVVYGPQLFACQSRSGQGGSNYLTEFGMGEGNRQLTSTEKDDDGYLGSQRVKLVDALPYQLGVVLEVDVADGTRRMLWQRCGRLATVSREQPSAKSEPKDARETIHSQVFNLVHKLGAMGDLSRVEAKAAEKQRTQPKRKAASSVEAVGPGGEDGEKAALTAYVSKRLDKDQPDFSVEEITALVLEGIKAVSTKRKRMKAEIFSPPDPNAVPNGMAVATSPSKSKGKAKAKVEAQPETPQKPKRKAREDGEARARADGATYNDGGEEDESYEERGGSAHGKARTGAKQRKLALPSWRRERDEFNRWHMRWFGEPELRRDKETGDGWQRLAIDAVLGGKDCVVGRATGSGKSLCFQASTCA